MERENEQERDYVRAPSMISVNDNLAVPDNTPGFNPNNVLDLSLLKSDDENQLIDFNLKTSRFGQQQQQIFKENMDAGSMNNSFVEPFN